MLAAEGDKCNVSFTLIVVLEIYRHHFKTAILFQDNNSKKMNACFLLAAVWLLARTCLAQTPPLRRYCQGREGNFPHPTNCGQYLSCSVRSVYVMSCPVSLHFNPVRGYCDYPARAQCRRRSSSNPTVCPSILVCPGHVLYFEFPDWSNCSSFYVCTSGDLEKRTCPDGLVYDFVNWRCTYPDEATCFEPQ